MGTRSLAFKAKSEILSINRLGRPRENAIARTNENGANWNRELFPLADYSGPIEARQAIVPSHLSHDL